MRKHPGVHVTGTSSCSATCPRPSGWTRALASASGASRSRSASRRWCCPHTAQRLPSSSQVCACVQRALHGLRCMQAGPRPTCGVLSANMQVVRPAVLAPLFALKPMSLGEWHMRAQGGHTGWAHRVGKGQQRHMRAQGGQGAATERRLVLWIALAICAVPLAGGREDADVRMMGEGRPFVMEIVNPRAGTPTEEQLRALERALAAANK